MTKFKISQNADYNIIISKWIEYWKKSGFENIWFSDTLMNTFWSKNFSEVFHHLHIGVILIDPCKFGKNKEENLNYATSPLIWKIIYGWTKKSSFQLYKKLYTPFLCHAYIEHFVKV